MMIDGKGCAAILGILAFGLLALFAIGKLVVGWFA